MLRRRLPLLISVILVVLILAPYLFAIAMNSDGFTFGGFLINPMDGHSYLAKMQQGFRGDWRFELPYTATAGNGAYLFLSYLSLGHLSRMIGLPLISVFHSVRILGALFLIGALYQFNIKVFEDERHQNAGFLMSILGSGLGWIAIFAGMFTSDFWVAEAYPFLSMYTNPHFTFGLALMILTLMPGRKKTIIRDLVFGVSLGIIQPFAVVIVLIVRVGNLVFEKPGGISPGWGIFKSPKILPITAFAIGGGSVLLYQYLSILTDPVLSMWNAQNITESPGLLDLAISLSPAIIFASLGARAAWKDPQGKRLIIWAVGSLILILIPWNLQRRFLTGIYIPLAGISIFGLMELERSKVISFKKMAIILMVMAIPTNIIVVASGIQAAAKQDPKIYYEEDIYSALAWIDESTSENALILADEQIGLLIPSGTGRNVIYGHPFETINAEKEREFVSDFFENEHEDQYYFQYVVKRDVDYIFLNGEGSPSLEYWINGAGFELAYENRVVRIFRTGH